MWWTFIFSILKDPKLLIIIGLSGLLAWFSVSSLVRKAEVVSLKAKVSELTTQVASLTEANKKLTQNRDALVKQVEDFMEIDKKYQSLQVRIGALQKTCAKPVKPVIVTPGTPLPISGREPKPVETAPGAIVSPGEATTPLPEGAKPGEPQPGGEEGVKIEQPEPEYQYGGREYEQEAKSIYNDVIFWFNSNQDKRGCLEWYYVNVGVGRNLKNLICGVEKEDLSVVIMEEERKDLPVQRSGLVIGEGQT